MSRGRGDPCRSVAGRRSVARCCRSRRQLTRQKLLQAIELLQAPPGFHRISLVLRLYSQNVFIVGAAPGVQGRGAFAAVPAARHFCCLCQLPVDAAAAHPDLVPLPGINSGRPLADDRLDVGERRLKLAETDQAMSSVQQGAAAELPCWQGIDEGREGHHRIRVWYPPSLQLRRDRVQDAAGLRIGVARSRSWCCCCCRC
mmetsp:Transcript_82825/g.208603  ORF Transcript_82825/g.208603 Transcript_82825/m.208603 type:complete len:200 (+) Transcript_82825:255-854(+)